MNREHDELLSAFEQLTNTLYWYRPNRFMTASEAIVEAVDDWIAEHAAEHNRSRPFTEQSDGTHDLLAAALTTLAAAVHQLIDTGARPELTAAVALSEAIGDWAAAATTQHHRSQPFRQST
jgi:hypothetical protein